MAILTHTQMDGMPAIDQSKRAILHVLDQIHTRSDVGWLLGLGTQSFSLLTEALATISGEDVEKLRTEWACPDPRNPVEPHKEAENAEEDFEGEYVPCGLKGLLLDLLGLWPEHDGINYSSYDEDVLIDLVRQSVERERKAAQ